jgi:arginine exporter protein ArgO
VALPVGAITTYLINLGARERFPVAAAAALGVATADGLFAVVAVAGGVGLQQLLRPASTSLTYLAAAVLAALAVRTVLSALRRHRQVAATGAGPVSGSDPRRAYLGLVALTALNPTTLIYFASLVLGNRAEHAGGTAAFGALFALGAFLASASWQLLLAGSGATLGRLLSGRNGRLVVAVVSGAIMLALAAHVLLA